MITAEAFYKEYVNFPPLLIRVFGHKKIAETLIEVGNKYKLNTVQQKSLVLSITAMLVKQFEPKDYVAVLSRELKMSEEQTKPIALEVLGSVVLPIQWYVGNVENLIRQLGGDVEKCLAEAKQNYPEVYTPAGEIDTKPSGDSAAEATVSKKPEDQPAILQRLDERLTTSRGRAEVLLRLTGLANQVEEAIKAGAASKEAGEKMMHTLDALSYAINTQDLNPLEVQAIKRKLMRVLADMKKISA